MPGHFSGRNVELGKYMDRIIGIFVIPFRINNLIVFFSLALCFCFILFIFFWFLMQFNIVILDLLK